MSETPRFTLFPLLARSHADQVMPVTARSPRKRWHTRPLLPGAAGLKTWRLHRHMGPPAALAGDRTTAAARRRVFTQAKFKPHTPRVPSRRADYLQRCLPTHHALLEDICPPLLTHSHQGLFAGRHLSQALILSALLQAGERNEI